MPGNLISSSFSRGEVTPELGGRVDLASYKASLATCRNMIVRSYGGVYNRFGTQFIGFAMGTSNGVGGAGPGFESRLRKFTFTTSDVYILEFSPLTMRVIRNDAYVLDTLQPIVSANEFGGVLTLGVVSHGYTEGDMLILDDSFVGASSLNGRWVRVGTIVDANHFVALDIVLGSNIGTTTTPYVSGGNAGHVYYITTPYTAADIQSMSFVQSADNLTITVADQAEGTLTRSGDASWSLSFPTFAPTIQPPTGLTVVPTNTGSISYAYQVTAIDATTGEESLPCLAVAISNGADPSLNVLTWVAPVGFTVSLYSVYLNNSNGIYGFIGDTPLLTFTDNNFAPDLATTPPAAANPFAGGNYPSNAMYFQQRLIRTGSSANPDTLYCSQVGLFYNMSVSTPAVDSDALTFTLTSREVNQVRHMVPIKQDLIAFSQGQEWRITANGAAFAAPNLSILPQSAWGSGLLEPINIGLTILSVRENGMVIRSYRYTYLSDAYTGEEVSLLSSHLFQPSSTIQSWAFGITPDPVIVNVLSDGTATCQTYQEEQQINAFTRWDTQGTWEVVEIARPDALNVSLDDEIYFVANRNVAGTSNVRTIEKIPPRRFSDVRDCVFMDASLTFDEPQDITNMTVGGGTVSIEVIDHGYTTGDIITVSDVTWQPTYDENWNLIVPQQLVGNNYATITVQDANNFSLDGVDSTGWVPYLNGGVVRYCAGTLGGLYHLEGLACSVLADGNVYLSQVVTNATITLPQPAGRIHVGLQFFSDVGTQALEAPQGSIQGKEARVPFSTVRVVNSRGWLQGQVSTDLIEVPLRQFEDISDPIALYSGDVIVTLGSDWEKNGTVFIRQPYPLPLEVIDIIPAIELED